MIALAFLARGQAALGCISTPNRVNSILIKPRGLLCVAPVWIYRRNGCAVIPPFHLDIDERRELFFAELERAKQEHGKLSGASADGIADMCHDPNDSAEAFALVSRLNRAAAHYGCPIIVSLHENPGSDTGKTRGHLGSELARKAETNLSLAKDAGGVVTMFSERSRSIHIPKADGPRFAWDNDAGMHLSCATARDVRVEQDRQLVQQLEKLVISGTALGFPLTHSQLVERAMLKCDVKERRAKDIIKRLSDSGLIKKKLLWEL